MNPVPDLERRPVIPVQGVAAVVNRVILGRDQDEGQQPAQDRNPVGPETRVRPEIQSRRERRSQEQTRGILQEEEHRPIGPEVDDEEARPEGVPGGDEEVHFLRRVVDFVQGPEDRRVKQPVIPVEEPVKNDQIEDKSPRRVETPAVPVLGKEPSEYADQKRRLKKRDERTLDEQPGAVQDPVAQPAGPERPAKGNLRQADRDQDPERAEDDQVAFHRSISTSQRMQTGLLPREGPFLLRSSAGSAR